MEEEKESIFKTKEFDVLFKHGLVDEEGEYTDKGWKYFYNMLAIEINPRIVEKLNKE